jgi:hypothetical protein
MIPQKFAISLNLPTDKKMITLMMHTLQ